MISYFRRTLAAHFRQGRSLYLLTVLGVALGVGAVLSIQIINRSAVGAFRGSIEAISSAADLSVRCKAGDFDEALLARVLADPQVALAWPLYRLDVRVEQDDPFYLELYGFDLAGPLPLPAFQAARQAADEGGDLGPSDFLTRPGLVAVTSELAQRQGWGPGSRFAVSSGTRRVELEVGLLLPVERYSPRAGSKLAVMDIAQVQGLLGSPGRIHQIDLMLRRHQDGIPQVDLQAVSDRLSSVLGPGFEVVTLDEQEEEARGLLSAFRLNLTALSMISLLVGLFLIYAATQASLLRRRAEFGLLRALGASRVQVVALILAEAALLGALGTLLGLPVGYYVALANIDLVSATLTNIYLLSEIESLVFPFWFYLLAAAIGIGGAFLGALLPALDVSRRHPRGLLTSVSLRERAAGFARPMALAGLLIVTATLAWWWLAGHNYKPAGFLLALAILCGVPLTAPLAVEKLFRLLPLRGFGFDYSLRTLSLQLHKTATAVAALSIAVSMLIGITLMIGSFRQTVQVWMAGTVQADIYVTTPSWRSGSFEAVMRPRLVEELRSLPQVSHIDRLRSRRVAVGGREIPLSGVDLALPDGDRRFPLQQGDRRSAFRQARQGGVLISEPLSRRMGLGVGDRLEIPLAGGAQHLRVAGVYYDYASERGAAVVDWDTFTGFFGDGPPSNLALYLRPGVQAEELAEQLKQRYSQDPLSFTSNRRLRQTALQIFDQTFAVVRILQVMSLLIAVCGITLTLLILAREGVSELALYRALGASRRQIFGVYLGKGAGMGLLGLALGALGGAALAAVLIFVINRDYFGWTIQVYWPWAALAQQTASILIAALAAAVYPALRASRTPATELNRDEM
ncbi:MAG TPA: ABC transporter permease [Acidobacteriota bacterium]|nr:ABC transporter permease [Acidobacteriota bacterium]